MKFQALFACEKVIIGQSGAPSAISIMYRADVAVPPEQTMSSNAVTPKEWAIFSMLLPSAEEINRELEEVYQMYWPNEEKFTENRLTFKPANNDPTYNIFALVGFPVGQKGQLRIITWIDDGGHRISDIAEYFVQVRHLVQNVSTLEPLSP